MANKVILTGRLGQDIELKDAGSTKVANISIATTEFVKGADGKRQNASEWHKVVLYGNLAELAQKYTKKGSKLYVEGKLRTRDYTNKDGQKVYVTEILANELEFLDGFSKEEQDQTPVKPSRTTKPKQQNDDDIPW